MVDLPQSRARLSFVDGLRLLAAVQMIQGHTLDALLANGLRQGAWFRAWTFSRGLTSTTFLLTAGLSLALAHAAERARGQRGAARRAKRALQLVALGYALRAPVGILFGDPPGAALRNLLAVDVLQCIGVSLLLLEGLAAVVQSRRVLAGLAAVLGSACFALAPLAEGLRGSGGWLLLTGYLSSADGSLFPLLPAAGYVFWGLAIAELSVLSKAAQARRPAYGLSLAALSALSLAGLSFLCLPSYAARVSPGYGALKLGLVLALSALLAWLLEGRALPRLLTRLASETLFLYVSHVLVLYAGHVGLSALLGHSASLPTALGWALCLLISTSLGALGYRRALHALRARFQGGTPRPPTPAHLG